MVRPHGMPASRLVNWFCLGAALATATAGARVRAAENIFDIFPAFRDLQ